MQRNPGMVVTDLDGTFSSTAENMSALRELGQAGVLRVVATGRSLLMARKILEPDFPIDYLVFSSGAGIVDWKQQRLLRSHHLTAAEIYRVQRHLLARRLDFMLHEPIPNNHRFRWWASGGANPDFDRRRERHVAYGQPWSEELPEAASQFLVVVPQLRADAVHEELKAVLVGLSVIRATSPLDRRSAWLEIFSQLVSKSRGAAWLAQRHGLSPRQVLAVGNDYNDWDLLAWAGHACVVGDAPPELCGRFPRVARDEESGFAEAVANWLRIRGE